MLPTQPTPKQAVDFLTLLTRLKQTKRTGWVKRNVQGSESIADHMYRMGLMAMLVQGTAYDHNKCVHAGSWVASRVIQVAQDTKG